MNAVAEGTDDQSFCLTFDGKKLKQGLTADTGDVDLLGFEDGPTLHQQQQKVKDDVSSIESGTELLKCFGESNINALPSVVKEFTKGNILHAITVVSQNANLIRDIKAKKEYAKTKFLEKCGDDWRKSKFVYAISAIKAYLYDIEAYLNRHRAVLDRMCQHVSTLNDCRHLYHSDDSVYLPTQVNYSELVNDLSDDNPRSVKQRSGRWHAIRQTALVTGSTIYGALGLDGLKRQMEHFGKVVCGVEECSRTPQVQANMDYGTENEINAVATLVGSILPVLSPDLTYVEEGCIKIHNDDKPFVVVSPDGSLRTDLDGERKTVSAVEFKCPTMVSHRKLPERYYLQCLSTMEGLDVDGMLYVCWRPDITTVIEVLRNTVVFDSAIKIAKSLYACDKPKRPVKVADGLRSLKSDIVSGCAEARCVGEFPSLVKADKQKPTPGILCNISDLVSLYDDVIGLHKDSYELQRQKASEAMVFLCCDLDRMWSKTQLRWSVCWFPKGYSLKTDLRFPWLITLVCVHISGTECGTANSVPSVCLNIEPDDARRCRTAYIQLANYIHYYEYMC
jgi:hypothetical protein